MIAIPCLLFCFQRESMEAAEVERWYINQEENQDPLELYAAAHRREFELLQSADDYFFFFWVGVLVQLVRRNLVDCLAC